MASSISYAMRVLGWRIAYFWDRACPYCGSIKTQAVGRKHMILQLRVCTECGLKYRFPKDRESAAQSFYDNGYHEPSVTDLPSKEDLQTLLVTSFKGSPFDRSEKMDFVISRLGESAREMSVLDYGASFGHVLAQLRSRGLTRLLGYEVSRHRARFGAEHLGEEIRSDFDEVLAHPFRPFDAVLASHVLEHLPRIGRAFELIRQVLRRPGGKLFIWVPNASQEALERFHHGSWASLVGEPHPLAIDYDFLSSALPKHGFRVLERGPRNAEELSLVGEVI